MHALELDLFLKEFPTQTKAGIITNRYGSIIEANSAAAQLLNFVNRDAMRNLPMASLFHRKHVSEFKLLLNFCIRHQCVNSSEFKIRPRSKSPFRAEINGTVIARTNEIYLIHWVLEDAELKPSNE